MKKTCTNARQSVFEKAGGGAPSGGKTWLGSWVRLLLLLALMAGLLQPGAARAEAWCGPTSDLENVIAFQEYAWWELHDAMEQMTDANDILAAAAALNVLDQATQALKAHLAENTGPCLMACTVCGNDPCTCVTVCPVCYSDPCVCVTVCPVCYSNPCVCVSVCPVCFSNPCVCVSVCPVCFSNPCVCASVCPVCFSNPCVCYY
ncbi:hypothetical protein [Prosthecobacter fluviatilis]|uniref:Uncharacterized protein n=1 Tax=Prosthecobacter fluviatilis TaxID=445931 RepID=A0ABW0KWE2_9BACT